MRTKPNHTWTVLAAVATLAIVILLGGAATPAQAVTADDAVLDWNRYAAEALINAPAASPPGLGQGPTVAILHLAMVQGAVYDAVNMATEIEASRLLVWQSAWLHDQGKRATLQSSFAKRFAADTAMKVTTDAVQVFGGYGYMKEYPVEKLMRDAKLLQIYEGTSQIQRVVIARNLLK